MSKSNKKTKNKKQKYHRHNEFYFFFKEIATASAKSIYNPEFVYPLLEANLDKINDNFFNWFKKWSTNALKEFDLQKAMEIALLITSFSNLLYHFPRKNILIKLEIAIFGYEIVLNFFKDRRAKLARLICPQIQGNLSLAYMNRIRGDRNQNIEIAIALCQDALRQINNNAVQFHRMNKEYQVTDSFDLQAGLFNNLAKAYAERIDGEKKDNIELAINYFNLAVKIHTRKSFPKEWAKLQHNLGEAYFQRVEGAREENLEIALSYLESALQVYTKDNYPILYANSLNTLGAILIERPLGDQAENLELAIHCLETSLQFRTYEAFPYDYTQTLGNLGNAYRERVLDNPIRNLLKAISIYQTALQLYTKELFPLEWARAQNNLGIAYLKLGNLQLTEYQELAISAFEAALQVYDSHNYPLDWAMTQKNLLIIYGERIIGDKAENLEKALQAYEAASQVFTRENLPYFWAKNQNNLALAYTNSGYMKEALTCFRFALEVFTPNTFYSECFTSARQLGVIATQLEYWTEAMEGFSIAIQAVETSRYWSSSELRRQKIIEESIYIYQNIVQACINAGEIEKGLEYAERSRSKCLVDLMVSSNLSQSANIPPQVQELLQRYEDLQRQIDAERESQTKEKNRSQTRAVWEETNQKIKSLQTEKQVIWEQLRREDPVLAGEIQVNPLKLSEIQNLIDNSNTAILSFYTTNSDTHIFVVKKDKVSLHTCTGEGLEKLQSWISQNWLLTYNNDFPKWEKQMESFLRELSQRLQFSDLINQHLEEIKELILIPHLLLHQIPFVALPIGDQEYLADRFLIRYTPSCQILEFCHQRTNLENLDVNSLEFGTVEDATGDLDCAKFEGEQIATIYNIPRENRLIGKQQATRKNYRQLAQKVQILQSSHHAVSHLDNPLESRLKLADGDITLGELMSPGWRLPQLLDVFLSCCETNLTVPALTDDILTLSTGFLCAGARSVISSLWKVDDLATALFSIFYHEQRKLGKIRPESLQQAQIKLRELRKADLKELSNHTEAKAKELQDDRDKYPSNSLEYENWKYEYTIYSKMNRRIKKIETSTSEFPFANPRYWSAFICQGLA